ncbi:MAG: uroporphyrinogen decarboxylase [Alphaproteobacteria bacterium]|nr:uroporphyrinogen decarboxylase [Alphaproteobacteria bacterium]
MTKPAERIRAVLEGRPVDRAACSFWTHFPDIDLDPAAIAAATVKFARALDLDLVKAMPNGLYSVEDWGVVPDFSAIAAGGVAKVTRAAVVNPQDWQRIRRLDPTRGAFGRELDHLRRLVRALGPDVPVLATTFSPLTVAKKLGEAAFSAHVWTHPEPVLDALGEIAATIAAFSREAIALGCAGVFFAVQEATPAIGEDIYRRFGQPYDIAALAGAKAGWCNTIHMHGDKVLFDMLKAYPVAMLNWHVGEAPPSIAAYRAAGGDRPILGGLRRTPITQGDRTAIAADIDAAFAVEGGRGIVLAPGCVIRHPVDEALLREVARTIRTHPTRGKDAKH